MSPSDDPSGEIFFSVVDLETSGLESENHRILQAAVVSLDRRFRNLGEWSAFVRPPRVLTADLGPVEIHGIRRRDVLLARGIGPNLRRIAELTAGTVVVAHNAAFDVSFLRAAARREGVEFAWRGTLCTLDLARRLGDRSLPNHRLATLCERFGVGLDNAHEALADARAAAGILPHLLASLGVGADDPIDRYVRS